MSTIFTKIISGQIPSYKIYEDDNTYAFLDINPETKGHTLVVPKVEVDKIYDLDDINYTALWQAAKKIAQNMEKVLGKRIIMKVIGIDVPHAHIHLMPFDETWHQGKVIKMPPEQMQKLSEQLRLD